MAPKGFDHVMVHHEAGRNLKLARLTAAEQCAWVFGVLPIAGKARMRGAFMVGDSPATADDVALQSGQSRKTAVSLLGKMRALGMLEADETIGAEWVHDFEEHNPEPKADRTSPERSKRYRERQKAKRHAVTLQSVTDPSRRDGHGSHGAVTPPEVEGEEKNTPKPPDGGFPEPPRKPASGRRRELDDYDAQVAAYAAWLLPDLAEPHRTQTVRSALGGAVAPPLTNERVAEWVRRFERGAAA